ncbi:MAG: efflux RND transporter permease subunit [Armatimonadota bacterium]
MWLTKLSLTRPVTILMLVAALIILGLQSRSRLPVDLYPDISFPMMAITTIYAGTGPEEMETLITKPIEDGVSTISGLKKLNSTSTEGVSTVMMEFELGTNLDTAASDVRSKIDALRNVLPQDAKAPVVGKLDVKALPVIRLSMSSQRRESKDVRQMAEDVIKDRLSQLNGVASVEISGGDVREVRVEVDKGRLQAYGLNIMQVANALQVENLNLPSGTIKEEAKNFAVRVMGEFTDPEQIRGVHIPMAMGNPNLTVGDIATVRDTLAEPDTLTRMNGGSSVSITVRKQSDANTVKVVDEVRHELEKMTGKPFTEAGEKKAGRKQAATTEVTVVPEDVEFGVSFDQSIFIKDALDDVYKSLYEGAFLAVLIVFLFLHSLRGTMIVALAIPTSLISTFLVMDMLGFSVNMMSMLGLSLCVGILVDDSIVVMENIHRHLQKGEPPKEAAFNGRTEIGLAAMTITLVDVVVFVPIAFMGGIVGQFFRQFGIVVATATLFSLFVSFTLTPMLAARWLKSHEREEEDEEKQHEHPGLFRRFTNAWETGYNFVDHTYRQMLAWALDHRAAVISLGLMTMAAALATIMKQPQEGQALWQIGVMVFLRNLLPLVVGLGSLLVIWWAVSLINGWPRGLAVVAALIASVAIMVVGTKLATTGGPLVAMLLAMGMFASMALMLSRSSNSVEPSRAGGVGKSVAVLAAVLLLIILFVPTLFTFGFMPAVDRRQFTINIEESVGTSLAQTNKTAQILEEALLDNEQYPGMKSVTTVVGGSSGVMSIGSSGADIATVYVELYQLEDLEKKNEEMKDLPTIDPMRRAFIRLGWMKSPMIGTDEAIQKVNRDFANVPGVKVTATMTEGGPGGGAPITIEVSGPDKARIQTVSEQIAEVLKSTDGTYSTEVSTREGRPELQAHIDRDRAARYGMSVAQIASALRTSLEGDTNTKYREGGKEFDIRVSLPKDQRNLFTQLPSMVVGLGPNGQPVYLYDVVTLEPAGGPTKVERVDRQRAITVSSQLEKGVALGNIQQVILPKIAQLNTEGVTIKWAGEAEMMEESFQKMNNALLLSIALVFMLMAALFESILAPLIIMLSVPQAMAGAFFALALGHQMLSIISMIGIIMLVGLVTKNAILMVDYTNTLRHEHGKSRRDALLEAGPTRLRPILMTTLAMVFGMMPTAIALSRGSEMRQPMAIAVIGGLLLSMFLTLLMVPVFYEIMDDLAQRIAQGKDWLIKSLRM